VEKVLKKMGRTEAARIMDYLDQRVALRDNPRSLGKPLVGDLGELWCYRVGDWRILCHIEDGLLLVLVVEIGHRSTVYGRQ
jgi:mRNA interferase RelE/StbE